MISILLSCYKSNKDYLKGQIDSIVNQTEKDWQLLVYNDNEDEKTRIEFSKFLNMFQDERIWYVLGKHLGYSKAYNYLLNKAEGEYICFCDHDDVWESDKLEIEKEYLDKHPDVDCVFGWLHWFGEKEKIEKFSIDDKDISKELPFWQPVKQPTVMFRKDRFGAFDSPYDTAGDYWFWSKHWDRHYHLIERVLINYRRHSGEFTKDKTGFREYTAKVIQRNMAMFGLDLDLDTCRALDRYSKTYDRGLKQEIQKGLFR